MAGKSCVCCIGYEQNWEPLGPGSGTLADGTTWTVTSGNITGGDPLTGDIEWSVADLVIEFSAPVQLRFTPYGIPSPRVLWHQVGGNVTSITVDPACNFEFTPGAVPIDVTVDANSVTANPGSAGVNVAADWGEIFASHATSFVATTYAFDAARFEVAPLVLGAKKDVCEVIGELRCDIAAVAQDLAALVDEDDQQITLAGNILTLEDGGTVDLSGFLDDTDDQVITAFTLSPAGILTLTIQDGNTVTADLSTLDTDTDDQTLALAGTLLTIADGNTVDLAAINTDQQTLSTTVVGGATTAITISNGNTIPILHPAASTNTLIVDESRLFHASVNPVDIHNNGTALGITETRADAGWTGAANGADYAGSPDSVELTVNVQVDENAASNYWALPEIIVTRNGVRIGAASTVLMQNNGAYSAQGTLAAHIVDPDPGANPSYRFLLEDDDSRTISAVPQAHSHVAAKAIEKRTVLAP